MTSKLAAFAVIIAGITGCACPPHTKIDIPPRPELLPVTQEQWDAVPPDTQDIWSTNDLLLKKHIRKLEKRIEIHDDLME